MILMKFKNKLKILLNKNWIIEYWQMLTLKEYLLSENKIQTNSQNIKLFDSIL